MTLIVHHAGEPIELYGEQYWLVKDAERLYVGPAPTRSWRPWLNLLTILVLIVVVAGVAWAWRF